MDAHERRFKNKKSSYGDKKFAWWQLVQATIGRGDHIYRLPEPGEKVAILHKGVHVADLGRIYIPVEFLDASEVSKNQIVEVHFQGDQAKLVEAKDEKYYRSHPPYPGRKVPLTLEYLGIFTVLESFIRDDGFMDEKRVIVYDCDEHKERLR